jgi:hypothetical protein
LFAVHVLFEESAFEPSAFQKKKQKEVDRQLENIIGEEACFFGSL